MGRKVRVDFALRGCYMLGMTRVIDMWMTRGYVLPSSFDVPDTFIGWVRVCTYHMIESESCRCAGAAFVPFSIYVPVRFR